MARFLITVWPFSGHYFPLMSIAHALKKRGHQVAFYTGKTAADEIENQGFECFRFQDIDDSHFQDFMKGRTTHSTWKRPIELRRVLRSWLIDTLPAQIKEVDALVTSWQPDVVVAETLMWGAIDVLHEARGIPVAVYSTAVGCTLPGPDASPGLGLPRPTSAWGRLRARAILFLRSELFSRSFRNEINRLRRDHDLPPIKGLVGAYSANMPLHLVPSVPEFDYNRKDLPPSVHYVGACVWNKSGVAEAPDWLADLQRERPCIHVTEGTVTTTTPLVLRAAAQGLAKLPMDVVMTTGTHRKPGDLDLGPLAPNIRVEAWIPLTDLVKHTDVVVTTGGSSTIMTALKAGVPMVVVPDEWDRPENGRRIVAVGAGIVVPPAECTPDAIREAVQQVLNEPSFRRCAQQMAEALARYAGPARAAELLETLVPAGNQGTAAAPLPEPAISSPSA